MRKQSESVIAYFFGQVLQEDLFAPALGSENLCSSVGIISLGLSAIDIRALCDSVPKHQSLSLCR